MMSPSAKSSPSTREPSDQGLSEQGLSVRSLVWMRLVGSDVESTDPVGAALAAGFMAQRTPAWTEPHVSLLDGLIERHLANRRDDPAPFIATLLVLLGVRSMIESDDRWNRPFELPDPTGILSRTTTHTMLAGDAAQAWADATNATDTAALITLGLGLLLHDRRHGTDHHQRTFAARWDTARRRLLDETGMALDLPSLVALTPQAPDDARRLFDMAIDRAAPTLPDRDLAAALLLSREWRLDEVETRLLAATGTSAAGPNSLGSPAGAAVEPILAAADASGPGQLSTLVEGPLAPCAQIVDLDREAMALRRAFWSGGGLYLTFAAQRIDPQVRTTFRVVGLEPRIWSMAGIDGASTDVTARSMIVRVPLVDGDLEFTPGSY